METVTKGQTVYIRPKWGFWNTTHYPYGGKFQRNGWSYTPAVVLRDTLDSLPRQVEVKLATGELAIVKLEALKAQPEDTH